MDEVEDKVAEQSGRHLVVRVECEGCIEFALFSFWELSLAQGQQALTVNR
jgi:hypothetical protein